MQQLFAYGTLMCPDILHAVCGSAPQGIPALLRGYSRRRVIGETYPALIAQPHGEVHGILYPIASTEAWVRLDRFEGDMYERREVILHLPDTTLVSAFTYLASPAAQHRLAQEGWSFEEFLQTGKQRFESEYRGFSDL